MIELLQPLEVERKDGVASLVLWLCEMFDEDYSFRETLALIQKALGGSTHAVYELPDEDPYEDFVEGHFKWVGREFSLYYERPLGYMQFSSASIDDVMALQSALEPSTVLQARG